MTILALQRLVQLSRRDPCRITGRPKVDVIQEAFVLFSIVTQLLCDKVEKMRHGLTVQLLSNEIRSDGL